MSLHNWKDKIKGTVFKNYIYLLMIQGANFILPLITIPYLVRTLGINKFGIVMVAQSFAILLTIITEFGLDMSATRQVALIKNDKKKVSQYFFDVFFLKMFLVIIAFIILAFCIFYVDKFSREYLVYFFSFGMVFGQALFPAFFFRGIEEMRIITIINVLAKVIFTISVFIIIKTPGDYYYVPILNGLGFILSGCLGFILSLKYVSFMKPIFNEAISIAKESFSLFLSNLAVSFYTKINTLIVGIFISDSVAGVYSSMEKLVVATKSIYIPLYQALFPNIVVKDKITIVSIINKMKYYMGALGAIISFLIFLFAVDILNLIYNDEMITSYYMIFQILGLIGFLSSLNMLFVSLFFPAVKAFNQRLKILSMGGIFNIILVITLVQYYSIYGVAISATISELFILIVAYYLYKREVNKFGNEMINI